MDKFGDENRVNSSKFNPKIHKFFKKFGHRISLVCIFVSIFPESDDFVAMPVEIKINVPICPYLISEGRRNCWTL